MPLLSLASAATTASLPAAVDEPSPVKVKLLRSRCVGRGARHLRRGDRDA